MSRRWKYAVAVVAVLVVLLALFGGAPGSSGAPGEKDGKGEDEITILILPEGPEKAKKEEEARRPSEESQGSVASIAEKAAEAHADRAKEGHGQFPPLWMNYRLHLGFQQYAQEMERLGCIFLLFSRSANQLYRIDRGAERLTSFDVMHLRRFAPVLKKIEEEPAFERYQALSDQESAEIYLAIPLELDGRLKRQTQERLNELGVPLSQVAGIHGFYRLERGRLALDIRRISLRDPVETKEVWFTVAL